jgi:SPP1 gp7 family putative phage head morphogenesis protein
MDVNQVIMEIYGHNAGELLSSFETGYTKAFFSPDWTIKDNNMLNRVQNNIFAFSGAKSYAQMQELRAAVYDAKGNLLPPDIFRKRARSINALYNKNYLEVERQNVMAAAAQASRWLDAEETADTHPYLEYVTKRDGRVREEHQTLDGIILPLSDPFWNMYYPPNGWRCRCSTRKLTERQYEHRKNRENGKNTTTDSEDAQKTAGRCVPKPFRHNVGTSEIIDRDGHPYFKAGKDAKEMQLSATKHYGMKPVKKMYEDTEKLAKYKGSIQSVREYFNYWEQLEGKYNKGVVGEGFSIVDRKTNISARFDRDLMLKIADRGRYGYFDEVEKIMLNPDEVWGIFKGSTFGNFQEEFFNVYIKYYEDVPIVVLVNNNGRVDSMYKWERGLNNFETFRTGLLKRKR